MFDPAVIVDEVYRIFLALLEFFLVYFEFALILVFFGL